jgi:antitoxin (DNA-binding transcriptional repressor) of toxin-antitoxin stability system
MFSTMCLILKLTRFVTVLLAGLPTYVALRVRLGLRRDKAGQSPTWHNIYFMIDSSIMKTATVADLRNHFRRISAWIQDGEAVAIIKRGKLFAKLVPAVEEKPRKKVDFRAQRKRIWGRRVFSSDEVQAMNQAEREGGEG